MFDDQDRYRELVEELKNIERVAERSRRAWANTVLWKLEREIAKLCLSASEPAIHKEVRNCSFYFFDFLGGVMGLLAPRPPP